jgi:hypothetical protein
MKGADDRPEPDVVDGEPSSGPDFFVIEELAPDKPGPDQESVVTGCSPTVSTSANPP